MPSREACPRLACPQLADEGDETLNPPAALVPTHSRSGVIDYTEFLAATLDKNVYQKEEACWAAFRVFDRTVMGEFRRRSSYWCSRATP